MKARSWGRYPHVEQEIEPLVSAAEIDARLAAPGTHLAHGMGRSYGDSCLNPTGSLLGTTALNRVHSFDEATGLLTIEAGASLAEVISEFAPRGWFLSVVPGTKQVTIGGAIANDIHGKNHHRAGSFGNHVRSLTLHRTDHKPQVCGPNQNPELFAATVGGLGLTGLISTATIQLRKIPGQRIRVRTTAFNGWSEARLQMEEADRESEYVVAWLDLCSRQMRGHMISGNHDTEKLGALRTPLALRMPFPLPSFALTAPLIRVLNSIKFSGASPEPKYESQGFDPFFFPLDGVRNWNLAYGRRGFIQYQFVVPPDAYAAVEEAVTRLKRGGHSPFLAVLKKFGSLPSSGMLSFPTGGWTLAIDFPQSPSLLAALQSLDDLIAEAGGRVYAAKDARMSQMAFRRFYPRWREFAKHVDPRFNSAFWQRVNHE